MKTILKAYKYRLKPSIEQKEYMNSVFGCVRFVWNALTANFNAYGSESFDRKFSEKELKEQYPFLKESISYALQQKRMDFDETKKQFFNKKRKVQLGRMKFKKKGITNDSFRIPGQCIGYNDGIDFESSEIKVPKLGVVKFIQDRSFSGKLLSYTISKTKTHKYFVSVLVEETVEQKQNTYKSVGIDLGLKDLMIFSDNFKIDNKRWFRESQSKLTNAQRHLSRKSKGSSRYNKQRLKVAKIHEKIANQRKWFTHNLTTWIIENYDIICLEDLNVSGMKKLFGKSISDANLSQIVNQLQYKAAWYGKTVYKIDRFCPSSKTCSVCGTINSKLTLSDRKWTCECGIEHDRDLNASYNILREGLKLSNSLELHEHERGEEVRLDLVHPVLASSMKRLDNF